MATVNIGRIKFVWQGAYSGGSSYVPDDIVSYNGSSYVCTASTTGNLPTNTTYWSVMASKGTDGTDITSLAGLAQGDILYYDGSNWVRLGAGTNGYFLKTQGAGANPTWAEAGGKFESALFHATSTDFSMSSGGWYTVQLSTVETNEISGASLSSNQISLPAGTYFIQSFVPFYRTNDYLTRLHNVTDGTTTKYGSGGHSWSSPNDATSPLSTIQGRFTLSGTKTVELQYQIGNSNSQAGLAYGGVSNNLLIWKTA